MKLPPTLPKARSKLAKIMSGAKHPAPCMTKAAAESLSEQVLVTLHQNGINASDAIADIPIEPDIRDL